MSGETSPIWRGHRYSQLVFGFNVVNYFYHVYKYLFILLRLRHSAGMHGWDGKVWYPCHGLFEKLLWKTLCITNLFRGGGTLTWKRMGEKFKIILFPQLLFFSIGPKFENILKRFPYHAFHGRKLLIISKGLTLERNEDYLGHRR